MVLVELIAYPIIMRTQRSVSRGRGFLGFAKTIMNDLGTSIKTTVTQEFSGDYYQAATKSVEKVYVPTNRKLTQVDYVNTLVKSTDFSGFICFPSYISERTVL